jgi:hypothetical protein
VAGGNSIQQNNLALIEWAGRISLDQIPGLLVFLAARLLAETTPKPDAIATQHVNGRKKNF